MRSLKKPRRASGTSAFSLESLEGRRLLSGGGTFAGGSGNAMAIAPDGTLYLAYYVKTSSTTGSLNYAVRDASGAWSAPAVLDDSSAQMGLYVTMALDSTGKPGVAYYDGYNADLRYAHWNGSSWDKGLVYTTNGKRGNYPSLAYLNDKPTISQFVRFTDGSGFLAVNQYSSPTPPATPALWTETQVENSGSAGRYSDIVFNNGKWGISYADSAAATEGPRYVESSGSSVTSGWGTPVVVPQPTGSHSSEALWTTLAYDSNNRPSFGFYNDYDSDAIFAQRSSSGVWSSARIDSHLSTGKYPTLSYESGQFRFAYYDEGNVDGLEVKTGTTPTGTWTTQPMLAGGVTSEARVVRANGVTTFSYSDGTNLYVGDDQAGVGWTKESGSTAFGARFGHASTVFDDGDPAHPGDEMWVIGGARGIIPRNDVWASNDGSAWRQVHVNGDANHAAFTPRHSLASVAFDGKMWVLGGQAGTDDGADVGDVWSTTNGQDWTKARSNGADVNFGARRDHSAVAFNGKMFVIGGADATDYPANPVVSSADGVTWTAVTGGATAGRRVDGVALVFNGSIYLTGATVGNADTYKSDSTGTVWTRVGSPNVNLGGGAGSVYDGKMWIVTGNGAYWSTDGQQWTQAAADPDNVHPFDYRTSTTVLTFTPTGGGTRLWLLGGYTNLGQTYKDEVWSTM